MSKEFIKMYVEEITSFPINPKNCKLLERGFIRKSDIKSLWTSDRHDDCYFIQLPNANCETIYVKKTDFDEVGEQDDDPDPRHKKLSQDDLDHWKQVYDYQMETLKATPITKEAIDKVLKKEHHFIYVGDEVVENTIKECIDLLSTDGKGTKQQVKQKLEELLK